MNALREQQQVQNEPVNNVKILQSELTLLRHQGSSSTAMTDNGADVQNLQLQMVQMLHDLSKEVQMLKQDRQSDLLRAQLNSGITPPNPKATSPAWSGSACAGIPTPVKIATPSKHSLPSNKGSQGSAFFPPTKEPSSPGSSSSSTTTVGGEGGGGTRHQVHPAFQLAVGPLL